MEEGARNYIRQIDEMGGMIAAIERGFPQSEIAAASYRYQCEVEAGERVIVGVNGFAGKEKARPPYAAGLLVGTEVYLGTTEDAGTRRSHSVRAQVSAAWNCSCSVEPCSAVVLLAPPAMTCATSSKYPVPTNA